jgi:hypothetical protein
MNVPAFLSVTAARRRGDRDTGDCRTAPGRTRRLQQRFGVAEQRQNAAEGADAIEQAYQRAEQYDRERPVSILRVVM